jgi:hypothetical protein
VPNNYYIAVDTLVLCRGNNMALILSV